jgi:intein/homing endonuclease
MAKQLGKLKQLPVNKTVVFWSPIEGDDVLVRTGTIAEGSCFLKGTRVYTTNGVKNIEDVNIGDGVVTHNGNVQPVVQTHKNKLDNRLIHKLNIYKTPSIMVTNNHPFYAVKRLKCGKYSAPNWVNVSDLDGSYYIMIPNQNSGLSTKSIDIMNYTEKTSKYEYITTDTTIYRKSKEESLNHSQSQTCHRKWIVDKDFCYFLGIWFGDGCINSVKRGDNTFMKGISVVASTRNSKVTDFVKTYGEMLFGIKSCTYINDKQGLVTVSFNNVIIAETFNSLFGKGFGGKHLPEFVYQLDTELVKHLVAGLITTDGCVDTKLNISLCMTNPQFIEELYHMCRARGIDCSASYRPSQSGKQTGYMRFTRGSVLVERLQKTYNDNRMERLLLVKIKDGNSGGNTLRINENTFLRVSSNIVTNIKPEYVYTLGIKGDHSYSVEGVVVKNCFFHALLHAYSKEYASMDRRGRMKFVRRLRASMAGKVDHESWEDMGGGLIAKIPFQENVNEILVNFYRFLSNDNKARGRSTRRVIKILVGEDAQELELYRLVTELIPVDTGFEQNILPAAYGKTDEMKIAGCCDTIIEETINYVNEKEEIKSITDEKAEYIRNIIRKFLTTVLKEAEDSAFKDYVSGLQNVAEDVDTYTIGLISDRFKRDIYFLDGKNRMPYNNSSTTENLQGRKSMVVLWIGGNHYEIFGRLLPGNRIQREFQPDDPIIKKLNMFLTKPSEITESYPELAPYIPREYRNSSSPSPNRFTDNESDNDSDKSSDHYYDSQSDDDEDESEKE